MWSIVKDIQKESTPNGRQKDSSEERLSKHRYLQVLIDTLGKRLGFVSEIEKVTPDKQGRVDVSLRKEGLSIACEVGLGDPNRELKNINKCLDAGYCCVVSVSTSREILKKIESLATSSLDEEDLDKVLFLTPEELTALLEKMALINKSSKKTIRGYKVRVIYRPISATAMMRKKEMISKLIVDSMLRERRKTRQH